jgi:hypothetical protein
MPRAPILVIGASRSGTSLLTRILRANGLQVGADVESNYESKACQKINRWILANASAGLEAPDRIDLLLADEPARMLVGEAVREYILTGRGGGYWPRWRRRADWFGFKDPRTTFTLPIWEAVFPNVQVIHMFRAHGAALSLCQRRARVLRRTDAGRPDLIAQGRSVVNLSAASLTDSADLWARYVQRADQHRRRLGPARAIEVRYEDLIADAPRVMLRLSGFVGRWLSCPDGLIIPPALLQNHARPV